MTADTGLSPRGQARWWAPRCQTRRPAAYSAEWRRVGAGATAMLPLESTAEEPDLFTMANLFPEDTGLPFVVWISPRGNALHDARIKVARSERATDFVASVAIRPEPRLVAGHLSGEDLALAIRWIELNRDVLIAYWDGGIQRTREAFERLQPLA